MSLSPPAGHVLTSHVPLAGSVVVGSSVNVVTNDDVESWMDHGALGTGVSRTLAAAGYSSAAAAVAVNPSWSTISDLIINANTLILTGSYQELTVSGAIDQADRTAARLAIQITGATADGDEMAIDDAAAYPP